MSAPSIPRPDFGNAPSAERTALPFGATVEASETVVLHIKVLSSDASERLAVARVLEQSLREQRVGAKNLTYLVTDENVTVELSTLTPIAAKITTDVMQRLGMQR